MVLCAKNTLLGTSVKEKDLGVTVRHDSFGAMWTCCCKWQPHIRAN